MKHRRTIKFVICNLFIVFINFSGFSQSSLSDLNFETRYFTEKDIYRSDHFHPAIKPYLTSELVATGIADTFKTLLKENSQTNYLFNENLFKISTGKFKLIINPLINFSIQHDFEENDTYSFTSSGFVTKCQFFDELSGSFRYIYTRADFPDYIYQKADSTGIVPQSGKADISSGGYFNYTNISGLLSWSPSKYINFQAGKDKNFIGDGYRSLLLSDNSNSYPFFKASVNIWKVKYFVMYSFLKDIDSDKDHFKLYNKYSTSHFLSWNLNRRINLSLFETVVWRGADSSGTRGFDINYLNPVIFFRPVEFSLGSPDNVIMGGGFRLKIMRNTHIYNQFILDEFKLNEVKADSGWWGNKYGFQFGLKSYDILKVKGLFLLAEYNFARPFTWSHRNSLENYGHYLQPLAHPLGANFQEGILILKYQKDRAYAFMKFIRAAYGTNQDSINVGQNIYQSYLENVNEYGNYLLQGNKTSISLIELRSGWIINPEWSLVGEIGIQSRKFSDEFTEKKYFFVFFGIKTSIENLYNEF